MKKIFILFAIGVLLISVPVIADEGPPDQPLRFETVAFTDTAGLGFNTFSVIKPENWQFLTGIAWQETCPKLPALPSFKLSSPDSTQSFEYFQPQAFCFTDDVNAPKEFPANTEFQGTRILKPVSALSYLQDTFLPQNRTGYRIISTDPLTDLTNLINRSIPQSIVPKGSVITFDSAMVTIAYRQDGKDVEEEITTITQRTDTTIQTVNGIITNTYWIVDFQFAFKAPAGELENSHGLFETILRSLSFNKDWFVRYCKRSDDLVQKAKPQVKDAIDVNSMTSGATVDPSVVYSDTYVLREGIYDAIADELSMLRSHVIRYFDPLLNSYVELPAGYDSAWADGKGRYILSKIAGFDPNIDNNMFWVKMSKS